MAQLSPPTTASGIMKLTKLSSNTGKGKGSEKTSMEERLKFFSIILQRENNWLLYHNGILWNIMISIERILEKLNNDTTKSSLRQLKP